MSELRLNLITNEWVIVAARRGHRPMPKPARKGERSRPSFSQACPFCPGHESETEHETFRVPGPGTGGWQTRVVLNKYPALSRDEHPPTPRRRGLETWVPGFGHHEVIIDHPRHDADLAWMERADVETMLSTYRARYVAMVERPHVAHVIIFRNYGEQAGTTLVHPHSQLITTPVVSGQVWERLTILEDHLQNRGGCLVCQTIEEAVSEGRRVLARGDHFVAFVPFAALSAYHTWIMPVRHFAHFGNLSDDELVDLAGVLRRVLRMVCVALDDPAYNYVIRSAPTGHDRFHWYLSLIPRVGRTAGFELGSGMYINPLRPEESAATLRAADTADEPG